MADICEALYKDGNEDEGILILNSILMLFLTLLFSVVQFSYFILCWTYLVDSSML